MILYFLYSWYSVYATIVFILLLLCQQGTSKINQMLVSQTETEKGDAYENSGSN